MGNNDERLLSKKYFKKSEEYYTAGFNTRNQTYRYNYWTISQIYKTIAECFEKLEKKGVENV